VPLDQQTRRCIAMPPVRMSQGYYKVARVVRDRRRFCKFGLGQNSKDSTGIATYHQVSNVKPAVGSVDDLHRMERAITRSHEFRTLFVARAVGHDLETGIAQYRPMNDMCFCIWDKG